MQSYDFNPISDRVYGSHGVFTCVVWLAWFGLDQKKRVVLVLLVENSRIWAFCHF